MSFGVVGPQLHPWVPQAAVPQVPAWSSFAIALHHYPFSLEKMCVLKKKKYEINTSP